MKITLDTIERSASTRPPKPAISNHKPSNQSDTAPSGVILTR